MPNPVDPEEDFADKWRTNLRLQQNFEQWLMQARADLGNMLKSHDAASVAEMARNRFYVRLNKDNLTKSLERFSRGAKRLHPQIQVIQREDVPSPWGLSLE